MKEPEPTDDTKPSDSKEHRAKVTSEQQAEITRLHKAHYGTRRIASFTGLARRTVQEVLRRANLLQQRATPTSPRATQRSGKSSKTSKLDAFRASCRRPRSSEASPPSAVTLRWREEGMSNRSNSTTSTRWIWFS